MKSNNEYNKEAWSWIFAENKKDANNYYSSQPIGCVYTFDKAVRRCLISFKTLISHPNISANIFIVQFKNNRQVVKAFHIKEAIRIQKLNQL
jgi:hypothetical protein